MQQLYPVAFNTELEQALHQAGLPSSDLLANGGVHLFANSNHQAHAYIGLEQFAEIGLLRSLVVRDLARGKGLGREMVCALEERAQHLGCSVLYLLTTSAESFFRQLGYQTIQRDQAPAAIVHSAQFSSLCPASAVVMMKTLGARA